MNVFKIHSDIINKYSEYIYSFIDIADERIKGEVEQYFNSHKLWPQPLIHFNPSYALGDSVSELCNKKIINQQLENIFSSYGLFKHQAEAIKLGVHDKSFIVTSGTGSGKSLTYIATIFNYLFNNPSQDGIKALIVYPMNALINSQTEEFNKYKEIYEFKTKQQFPITYKQYTGQESKDEKEKIVKDPPDIILTNYMMLELIMTRFGERLLRESLIDKVKFVVFDELHTYRGRQGSDVSLLIRRIKSLARNNLVFMGTSATMVSGESYDEQKSKVAEVASKIFGEPFTTQQIINETLISGFPTKNFPTKTELAEVVSSQKEFKPIREDLFNNPLTLWIEKNCAVDDTKEEVLRRKPLTQQDIASKLSEFTDVDSDLCENRIVELLKAVNAYNSNKSKDDPAILPFKIHQFISQTGSVYVTLDIPAERDISLDYTPYKLDEQRKQKPFFNLVFSRISGYEFICVRKDYSSSKLIPREFADRDIDDLDDDLDIGYLIFDETNELWQPEDIAKLPDTWLNNRRNGDVSIKKNYKNSIPQKIYFDEYGNFSETDSSLTMSGWYISFPLLFDPTCGVFYDKKTNESTKLSKLGVEGRSTSTTVLSISMIKALHNDGVGYAEQKLLSFTDNRQDAALQAGHFNDYYKTGRIRSAIYQALVNEPENKLDYSNIARKVFTELNLPQSEFATQPSSGDYPAQARENEEAFITMLTYRILYDLKRGWRVTLPNLEQCGLLSIDYKYLDETIESGRFKNGIKLTQNLSFDDRHNFIVQVLDYFRKNYVLKNTILEKNEINRQKNVIREKVKSSWGLNKREDIPLPAYARLEAINSYADIFTISLGLQSYFGKYIRLTAKQNNLMVDSKNYADLVYELLDELAKAGYLSKIEINSAGKKIPLYQLNVSQILWSKGDGDNVRADKVRLFSYKQYKPNVNQFFKKFYEMPFNDFKNMVSYEHTAQIKNEDRIVRETDFRKGDISLLCCSPTMELGIDIATLNIVHMRNVPPNPANYAQRGGRAGRSGQAALIFTFCSNFSPHDQHYFANPTDMVSGVVQAPRLDLLNEELLETHLHSLYMAEVGLDAIDKSMELIVDIDDLAKLPVRNSIKDHITINEERREVVFNNFKNAIKDFEPVLLAQHSWYNDDWIRREVRNTPDKFDRALDRWRELYKSASRQIIKAQEIITNPNFTNDSKEKRAAYAEQKQANKQIDFLLNRKSDEGKSFSEFYPYRYLASEGFFPGYNFTRLPVRAYVAESDGDGEYISRSRFLALREFGPTNIIYHNSSKYRINQLILNEAESKIQKIKVSKGSGYALTGEDYSRESCPFTDKPLKTSDDVTIYTDLLPMSDMRTYEIDRISCEEEERLSMGFDISTYFTVKGGLQRVKTAIIKDGDDSLLKLRFVPAATLIKLNEKWKARTDPGFLINLKTGFWKKEKDLTENQTEIKRVRLFTEDTADALYIHPLKALAFDESRTDDGIITLMYAIKRGIETVFQVESSEIGVEVMGDPAWPNILIYEASEGSLGILSQLTEDVQKFKDVIKEAYSICHFKDGEDEDPEHKPATYYDLLSYYNQRYHQDIDRFLIKDQLEKLMNCSLEILGRSTFGSYDEHYNYLVKSIDPNSSTELKFIKYLYDNGYRLPDEAQYTVSGIYVLPDFYYKETNTCVFCDGTPHNDQIVKEQDRQKREALINKGYDVFVYYYKDSLEEIISNRPDIFKKVR